MYSVDIESVFWYLNDYEGTIPPSHNRLSGIGMDALRDEISKLGDRERLSLYSTAKNLKAAINGTASRKDADDTMAAVGKPDIRRMHLACPCLSKLLTSKEDIPDDLYGKDVADAVHDMLAEIGREGKGKGCSSCKRGRILSKYRARLYSLLKEGEHC